MKFNKNRAPHAASAGSPNAINPIKSKYSAIEGKTKELYRQLDAFLGAGDAAVLLRPGQELEWSFDDLIVVMRGPEIPDDFFNRKHTKFEALP
jgi:hypothetical protein